MPKITNKYILKNTSFFEDEKLVKNKDIIIENGIISNILDSGDNTANLDDVKEYDCTNLLLSPAFIDLQINGCGGVLLNDNISINTLEVMHKTNKKYGCTSFLPTLITTDADEIKQALEVVYNAHKNKPNNILGIHIEGPYISIEKKGAHNPKYIKPIDDEMVDVLCSYANKMVVKLTLAPENNSSEHIKKLFNAGVKLSIGHSNATYKQAIEAINNGISLSTHLFNAMSALQGREPGVVGAILNSDIYAGIITDGIHVDYANINLVHKIKKNKLYIVSDAVTPMGTDMKEFYLANQKVIVENGRCVNESGSLAGANIDMLNSLINCIRYANISKSQAFAMATNIPAIAIGVDSKLGFIKKGYIANLVILDNDYKIHHVIDNGILEA
jgi:N-acetylglucosamine-6-phosphate deacetylase